MSVPTVGNRSVLVTGCSSGIGLATAEMLRSRGWKVFSTARKADDIDALKLAGFEAVKLDLSSSESIQTAVEWVQVKNGGELGALVNNAGFGMPGAIQDLSREAMRRQFEVNVFGLQELTNSWIPVFRKQRFGRIVNVSSVVGRLALPFMGIYSASKFALEAISDAQRVELSPESISVSLIEPGPIRTRFSTNCAGEGEDKLDVESSKFGAAYRQYFDKRRNGGMAEDRFRLPPEAVARKILHALESPKPKIRYKVTIPAYAGDFAARFVPARLIDRLMTGHVKKRFG
ncbi:SDR family NAD(P)-dependent oxidoreductase [Pontiella agarivorans]|uniref:SDR family NAD(P)-dependent oxidoreductase n=1 Tax=Pontiella agarivorans TaxID=3038953 RepID=A0ABU5MSI1_9BACT|nr:SDR family NAD(P)-dependent oxidoreductase [Pontiella agarivorans]MDZ8117101.1 SDR family NAD(P)-dependent oxidoreductase [Pontiella agarivorans]